MDNICNNIQDDDLIPILEIRQGLKLSQEDFAYILGVSSSSVYRWENGVCKPSKMARRIIQETFLPR